MPNEAGSQALLQPFDMKGLELRNRVVLAPMTRSRAGAERLANALMAEYYAQRAGAGLLIGLERWSSPRGATFGRFLVFYGVARFIEDMFQFGNAVGSNTENVLAFVEDLTFLGRIESADAVEQTGFTVPVGPNNREDFTTEKTGANVIEGLDSAEGQRHILNFYNSIVTHADPLSVWVSFTKFTNGL